jgi:hypothetical protein
LDQTIMGLAFTPAVNYYCGKAAHLLTDKKNIAIGLMGAYIMKNAFKSKL